MLLVIQMLDDHCLSLFSLAVRLFIFMTFFVCTCLLTIFTATILFCFCFFFFFSFSSFFSFFFPFFFFFQAEDGIRDIGVTGVQTCALPICRQITRLHEKLCHFGPETMRRTLKSTIGKISKMQEIGRASCRERV